jgi:hypothetical protein
MKVSTHALASALALAACIGDPPKPGVMCKSTGDCASGEVCQQGVCWGNPPAGMFASALVPPPDRTDLVTSEQPPSSISQDGWLGDVTFATPVMFSGRVEAYCAPGGTGTCDSSSLGATITITRKSEFAGGPGVHATIAAMDGVARGTNSFTALLPPTSSTDAPYTVTVVPDGRGDQPPATGLTPAMTAPPARTTLMAPQSTSTTFVLGNSNTATVSGVLTDGLHALTKYRVAAIGQWDASSPLTEVSSVAYTTDGTFKIAIADGVTGPVEIVAKPYDATIVAPTLHLGNVTPGASSLVVAQPQNLGNKLTVTIPIVGVAGSGALAPVSGARVIVTGTYDPLLGGTRAVLSVETTTGPDGLAHLDLLDGAALHGTYKLRVIPQAGNVGVVFDAALALDANTTSQMLAPVRLPSRIALQGIAVDSSGHPLANVAVTARPSLRFAWTLDAAAQEFLAQIPEGPAVTPDTGDFAVWVDPFIADVWGHYDLTFEPPAGAAVPSWTVPEVEIPRVQNLASQALGSLTIPDAAFIHGQLDDPNGGPVASGELRFFNVITDLSLCSAVPHPPQDCEIPAQLLGHGTADDQGVVQLTLPRP